jgi:hypothetical protein
MTLDTSPRDVVGCVEKFVNSMTATCNGKACWSISICPPGAADASPTTESNGEFVNAILGHLKLEERRSNAAELNG